MGIQGRVLDRINVNIAPVLGCKRSRISGFISGNILADQKANSEIRRFKAAATGAYSSTIG